MKREMRQAFHIFKKDVRYLQGEICLVVALAAVFAWKQGPQWAEILLPVAAVYLIGRLIHGEAIPGDRQFWITRPYRWQSLLAAKVSFIVVFVSFPICLAQLYLLTQTKFPLAGNWQGLLWSQFVTLIAVWLPVAALAAMTSSILPFNFSLIVLVAAAFVLYSSTIFQLTNARWPVGFQWVQRSVGVAAAAIIAFYVLYMQYKKRSTSFARSFAFAAIAVTAAVMIWLPISWAMDFQSRIPGHGVAPPSLQFGATWDARDHLMGNRQNQAALDLRLFENGIPDGEELQVDDLRVALKSPDGKTQQGETESSDRQPVSGHAVINNSFFMPLSFFNQERDKPLTLHVAAYFTVFGNPQSETIPLRTKPVAVMDGLQCGLARPASFVYFACSSAFRWPDRLVLVQQGPMVIPLGLLISYSPFPSGISLDDAVDTKWTSEVSVLAKDVTIIVKEPIAHFRRDFEIDNIRLADQPGCASPQGWVPCASISGSVIGGPIHP